MWFLKTNDIFWKGKIQDIFKSIEIMKISTIVWENISKADQAMILHGVRLYLVSVIVWEIANLWKFVEELLKVIKIQNFCFYYLLIIPRCLINPLFNP